MVLCLLLMSFTYVHQKMNIQQWHGHLTNDSSHDPSEHEKGAAVGGAGAQAPAVLAAEQAPALRRRDAGRRRGRVGRPAEEASVRVVADRAADGSSHGVV